jgi:hypothetical protein
MGTFARTRVHRHLSTGKIRSLTHDLQPKVSGLVNLSQIEAAPIVIDRQSDRLLVLFQRNSDHAGSGVSDRIR